MTLDLTRREWLIGGTAIGASLLAANSASAQTVPDANLNPTQQNPIRAGFNENVYGHSKKAKKVMLKAAETAHLYDFFGQRTLNKVISEMENLPGSHIAIDNGSTPFLEKSAMACAIQGGKVLAPAPTYGSVTGTAKMLGIEVVSVPVGEDMHISLDAMRAAMTDEIKLIYLCNPNNPIPSIIEKNALKDFCIEMSKRALIVIDEAYYEYVSNPDFASMKDLVTEHKNIIICRTASKIHGFAGVRIGFAFAHPDTMRLITGPFNLSLSNVAVAGAVESYQDTEYMNFIKQKNRESMDILEKMFEEFGYEYIKSNSNFAFFNAGRPSTEVATALREHGIMSGRPFPPFTNWVRMSTVKPEEMQYVVDAYKKEFG
ncbi:MAG: aminotransferase class I/II-fold pyridoxal phosphate-dependent enzyme [Kordiimonadaceae bacterium]|jgi:histidinol-phosphate aminotransferase|nr:aminotransferase class I/II-fold pyridoxal phosphate-dependent enzyme [Kordiimonadaceae bacterium]MBT6330809.1 aminotransferase class I/II-fold pyridoxal phosphate-dependent enzyme [Kordiimonadaceae bacterium]